VIPISLRIQGAQACWSCAFWSPELMLLPDETVPQTFWES